MKRLLALVLVIGTLMTLAGAASAASADYGNISGVRPKVPCVFAK